jgi:alanine racemase
MLPKFLPEIKTENLFESRIEISRSAFNHNLNLIKNYAKSNDINYDINNQEDKNTIDDHNCQIIPVIKANAYGHGANLISDLLLEIGVNKIAVAYINEAIELRNYGFKDDILVLVPIFANKLKLALEYNLEITIQNFKELDLLESELEKLSKKIKVHLFLDTGMHRDGFQFQYWENAANRLLDSKYLQFSGIMSHFAASESKVDFTYSQRDKLIDFIDYLVDKNKDFKRLINNGNITIHLSNSLGIFNRLMNNEQIKLNLNSANLLDNHIKFAVRPGISLHGVLSDNSKAEEVKLIPTLSLKSNVIDIKFLKKGETAGYSFRYIADNDHFIAIVPIGYADGYCFGLGNKAEVLIKGKRFRVIGSVCMDQIIVNLEHNSKKVSIGDEVVLIGSQDYIDKEGNTSSNNISVYEIADLMNTIPYEIFTGLSSRLNRIIVK